MFHCLNVTYCIHTGKTLMCSFVLRRKLIYRFTTNCTWIQPQFISCLSFVLKMINNRSSTLLSKFIEKYITLKWGMKFVYSRLWYKCWWRLPMDDLLMSKCWIQADVPYSKIVPLFLKHSKLIFYIFEYLVCLELSFQVLSIGTR